MSLGITYLFSCYPFLSFFCFIFYFTSKLILLTNLYRPSIFLYHFVIFCFLNFIIKFHETFMYCNNYFYRLFKKTLFSVLSFELSARARAYLYSHLYSPLYTSNGQNVYTTSHETFPVWGRGEKRRRCLRLVLFRLIYTLHSTNAASEAKLQLQREKRRNRDGGKRKE